MQANVALRKGLGAVVGLNFDMLAPELQLKMMRPMTTTRYKKVLGFDFGCRLAWEASRAKRAVVYCSSHPVMYCLANTGTYRCERRNVKIDL